VRYQAVVTEALSAVVPAPGWVRQQLPEAFGECYSDRFALSNDLAMVHSKYFPSRDVIERSIPPNGARTLVITLGIEGDSGYVSKDGAALAFRCGHTTLSAFRNSVGERRFSADSSVRQLRLLVGESTLTHYLGAERTNQLLGADSIKQLAFRKTSPSTLAHARALMRCAAAHSTDALTMHIHALNLLAEQLQTFVLPPAKAVRFSARDIEKLELIRSLMQEKMDQPLSIAYLCATVGINESKLKEGFQFRFNTTPHRMLMELRMRKALLLLESGSQVAEAAYQVGYQHPSNFSAAFTNFFGRTPKSVFGKRTEK
jgi:AraC-like DNA-binding protein